MDFLGFWPNHELTSTKCSLEPSIVKISTQEKKLNLRRIFITFPGNNRHWFYIDLAQTWRIGAVWEIKVGNVWESIFNP